MRTLTIVAFSLAFSVAVSIQFRRRHRSNSHTDFSWFRVKKVDMGKCGHAENRGELSRNVQREGWETSNWGATRILQFGRCRFWKVMPRLLPHVGIASCFPQFVLARYIYTFRFSSVIIFITWRWKFALAKIRNHNILIKHGRLADFERIFCGSCSEICYSYRKWWLATAIRMACKDILHGPIWGKQQIGVRAAN